MMVFVRYTAVDANMTANMQFFINAILVLLIVLVVALLAMWYVMTSYKEAANELQKARGAVSRCRKRRYDMTLQIMSAYSPLIGDKARQRMSDMMSDYRSIKYESKEIKWESKWMPMMASMNDSIEKRLSGQSLEAFKAMKDEFEHNEGKMSVLHDRISHDKDIMSKIDDSRFLSFVKRMSERLLSGIKKGKSTKEDVQEKMRKLAEEKEARQHRYDDLFD